MMSNYAWRSRTCSTGSNSAIGSLAIAVGSDGDKEEQEVAEACNRLIKNAIVCWNYLLLEHRLNQASTDQLRAEIRAAVANHSVISWGHINLLGEYDFSDEKSGIRSEFLPQKPT